MQCYSVDSVAEKKERMGVKKNRTKLYGQKMGSTFLDLLTTCKSWLSNDLELGCHGSVPMKFSAKNTIFDCGLGDFSRGIHIRVDS